MTTTDSDLVDSSISEEELLAAADELFLEYDRAEARLRSAATAVAALHPV